MTAVGTTSTLVARAGVALWLALGLALAAAEAQGQVARDRVAADSERPPLEGTAKPGLPGLQDALVPLPVALAAETSDPSEVNVDSGLAAPVSQPKVKLCPACELMERFRMASLTAPRQPASAARPDPEVEAPALNDILDIFHCCILTWGILTVMLPAFLLGAAITAFVPSQAVLSLLGPGASRFKAYGAAVGAGMVLSLCSCNVVPLFAGIWRRGAGSGPAFAFLYAGPAINLVAIVFTCQVFGVPMGVFRTLAVAVIAVAVGMLMARLFGDLSTARPSSAPLPAISCGPGPRVTAVLVGLLLYLLLVGSFALPLSWRLLTTLPAAVGIVVLAVTRLGRDNTLSWLKETWQMVRLVVPILLPAVLIIGLLALYTPLTVTRWMSGNNGLLANLGAASFGALMYFPILTEVAFSKAMVKVMGMSSGPAMALLLTAPGLSLPGMIILWREIGWKRVLVYVASVTAMGTLAGLCFGSGWMTALGARLP